MRSSPSKRSAGQRDLEWVVGSWGPTFDPNGPIARRFGLLLLLLASAVPLVASMGWWSQYPPLGDDASSHIVAMARVAEAIDTGSGWWAPDYNLGFPIGLYYQPLPHFVGGVLTLFFGGGTAAITVYKVLSTSCALLFPWAVALGGRRLGLSVLAASLAGFFGPLVTSQLRFGLTVDSSLVLGLHSQAWATVLFPLAVGEVARLLRGERGALWRTTLTWTLLALSHFFYAIALGALAIAWLFCRSPKTYLKAVLRLAVVVASTGACLAFWLLPMVTSQYAMGGWPFGSTERVDGYGFAGFLGPLLDGDILDALRWDTGSEYRGHLLDFPVLTWFGFGALIALAVTLVLALARWLPIQRQKQSDHPASSATSALLLVGLTLSALLTIGRAGLGDVVDLYSFNSSVQMFRYLGLFHLLAVWTIGFGLSAGVSLLHDRSHLPVFALGAIVLLSVPAIQRGGRAYGGAFTTVEDADLDTTAYMGLVEAMRAETRRSGSGRVFAHPRSGVHGHYHSGLLALWSAADAGESYGVGLHDSLNFYFLEFFHPERGDISRRRVLMELYGFQYIVSRPDRDFLLAGAVVVYQSPQYTLWRMSSRVPLCQTAFIADIREGRPREIREEVRRWLTGNGPMVASHFLYRTPQGFGFGGSTGAPVDVGPPLHVREPEGPNGTLLLDSREADRISCRVDMTQAGAVIARVGYHPYWQVTVDGQPVELFYATPAYNGVQVDPGTHEVVFRFRQPSWVHPLLGLALLPVPLLAWVEHRRRKRGVRPTSRVIS